MNAQDNTSDRMKKAGIPRHLLLAQQINGHTTGTNDTYGGAGAELEEPTIERGGAPESPQAEPAAMLGW